MENNRLMKQLCFLKFSQQYNICMKVLPLVYSKYLQYVSWLIACRGCPSSHPSHSQMVKPLTYWQSYFASPLVESLCDLYVIASTLMNSALKYLTGSAEDAASLSYYDDSLELPIWRP